MRESADAALEVVPLVTIVLASASILVGLVAALRRTLRGKMAAPTGKADNYQVVQHFDPEAHKAPMQTRPFHLWCVGSARGLRAPFRRGAGAANAKAADASSEDGECNGLLKH